MTESLPKSFSKKAFKQIREVYEEVLLVISTNKSGMMIFWQIYAKCVKKESTQVKKN